MSYSNDFLKEIADKKAHCVSFTVAVVFEFYDGIEEALIVVDEKVSFYCSSLADSRSRRLRAYVLKPLDENWRGRVLNLPMIDGFVEGRKSLYVPSNPSENLTILKEEVSSAEAEIYYIGIGAIDLSWIRMVQIMPADFDAMISLSQGKSLYNIIHNKIRVKYD